jgi:alpha-N-acetylglucosamine transferase
MIPPYGWTLPVNPDMSVESLHKSTKSNLPILSYMHTKIWGFYSGKNLDCILLCYDTM